MNSYPTPELHSGRRRRRRQNHSRSLRALLPAATLLFMIVIPVIAFILGGQPHQGVLPNSQHKSSPEIVAKYNPKFDGQYRSWQPDAPLLSLRPFLANNSSRTKELNQWKRGQGLGTAFESTRQLQDWKRRNDLRGNKLDKAILGAISKFDRSRYRYR